jgi:Putative zinc dependent peptidase (DUF5700)
MRLSVAIAAAILALVLAGTPARAQQQPSDRLQLTLDVSEADAVLAILAKGQARQPVDSTDWRRLFATEPYRRLKAREASMHRAFTDADFQRFVQSDSLGARAADLRQTLADWRRADLDAAAARAFAYLPADARIKAKVFPVIKPRTNSFVFEASTDAAIFLYLDPAETEAQFENTVAHELHHIGFASVSARGDSALASLPPDARAAAEWVGAFGEGFAMLAAAGGPDVHPHAESPAAEQARWDHDLARFGPDLLAVQQFLLDVARGKLKTAQERDSVGYGFFGVQGPWYTVGWKMAVVVERRFGRAKLIECMLDPRQLLAAYNSAAAAQDRTGGESLPLWSDDLLQALGAVPAR